MESDHMTLKIAFFGGVGTVTGSKYLIETETTRLMVDCGLFQGYKQLRLRNWRPLPVAPDTIDAVLLTHAHIDHSGYLPVLVKNGFKGPVYCTEATTDLSRILLRDSGYLQEREAERANKYGYTKHDPAKPLYGQKDAAKALEMFHSVEFDEAIDLPGGIRATFRRAGHILGAAIVELDIEGRRIVFSGDLGRFDNPIMNDPSSIAHADYLLVESTYGNRLHGTRDPEDALEDIIVRTAQRGGTILIPSFAVGRAQTLLFYLHRLKKAGRIPDLPIYLDSPMAINATELFCRHSEDHKLTASEAEAACHAAAYVHTGEESKELDSDMNVLPKIIISASGMATGGRILHHLKRYAPDARNTILFAGFQAGGTRGAAMVGGATEIKIHGAYHPVKAEVACLHMLSAHADADEIMRWLSHFAGPPKQTFIVHGEPDAADTLRHRIQEELGWTAMVPEHGDFLELI
jgi:metallo-beta-lactamase family protein